MYIVDVYIWASFHMGCAATKIESDISILNSGKVPSKLWGVNSLFFNANLGDLLHIKSAE